MNTKGLKNLTFMKVNPDKNKNKKIDLTMNQKSNKKINIDNQ